MRYHGCVVALYARILRRRLSHCSSSYCILIIRFSGPRRMSPACHGPTGKILSMHANACLPWLEQPHSCSGTLSCFTQQRMCLQPFLAPFVLTRPRCTGDEDRLVDCPGLQQPAQAGAMPRSRGTSACRSLSDGSSQRPGYAVVACGTGMDAEAGIATPSWPAHTRHAAIYHSLTMWRRGCWFSFVITHT